MKVVILTPTTPQRDYLLQRCKKMAAQQDYPDTEHVIVYGNDTIGNKLNRAIQQVDADLYIRFDDDDAYAPDYVSKMVQHMKGNRCALSGLSAFKIFNLFNGTVWDFNWNGTMMWVGGSGMAFWRETWEVTPFMNSSNGEDTMYCMDAGIISPLDYPYGMIACLHGKNTESHKHLSTFPIDKKNAVKVKELYTAYTGIELDF